MQQISVKMTERPRTYTGKRELTRLFLRCINRNSFSPPLAKLPGIISQVSVYSYSLQMCQVAATAGPLRMDPYVKLVMEHVDTSGATNTTFAAKYETWRIWAQIVDGSVRSLYSVFGDADDHFVINDHSSTCRPPSARTSVASTHSSTSTA